MTPTVGFGGCGGSGAHLESLGGRRELEDRDVQGGGLSLRGGKLIARGGELRFDGVALRDCLGEGGQMGCGSGILKAALNFRVADGDGRGACGAGSSIRPGACSECLACIS